MCQCTTSATNVFISGDATVQLQRPGVFNLSAIFNSRLSGGIYHRVQIELTYNSNHIEGSRLSHDQTRYIYETNTIGITEEAANVDVV